MIEFSKYKLGDICNIVAGGDAPKEVSPIKTNEFDIPIYSNGIEKEGLYGYTKTPRITEKAVTLSARGTIGIPFNRKTPYYPIVRLISLTSKVDNLNIDYLYYALKQFKYSKDGSVQQQLTVPMISEKTIHLPDLPTQKKIADVLSCIDDKIALNNKTNNELENMAKTVYDYWFTQFDFPDANGKPYKSSGGKMEYNQVLKREIPAGWENGCFGDLIEIGNGKDHSKLAEGDIPVYGSGGFMRTVEKALYEGESVLFPRKGTLNNVMYVNESFWTVDTMFYSIPKIENVPLYVFYNAKHFDFEKMNTGTGVPSMTSSIIKELPIVIPDSNVLKNFNDKVQPIYHQIFRNQKETEELTKLRDFLLPLLMNGQIEVK